MTPKDMMVIDANAEALGIPRSLLMENAGRCIASKIFEILDPCKVSIFAGTGGNGGDGFVAARHLLKRGFEVEVILLSHPSHIRSAESRENWEVLKKISPELSSLTIRVVQDSFKLEKVNAEVVVDAILGTGVRGEIREPISSAVDIINSCDSIKIAADVPTGLDPLTGHVKEKAVKADFTVTFHMAKIGLQRAKIGYVGRIHICDIGIPDEAESFTGPGDILRIIKRDRRSYKGQNGRLLVVGGNRDYSGAPALAAMSALRSGVDLAVVTCPSTVVSPIRSYSPDLIVKGLSDDYLHFDDIGKILKLTGGADAMVLGCGIGREEETGLALNEMIEKIQIPMVIDADALRLLDINVIKGLGNKIVLTPHKSEFKSVFGLDVPENLEEKTEAVLEASKRCGCTILLKGAVDVISEGETVKLNSTGNPGMTVGGTGDVLAGLVGSLMSQGHDAFEAAYLGAFINGTAGDFASEDLGYNFIASDILKYIPKVLML